jgi:hypothetical protein
MYNYLNPDGTADIAGEWDTTIVSNKVTEVEYINGGYTVTLTVGGKTSVVKN